MTIVADSLLNKKNENEYLKIARIIAKEAGYNEKDLTLANDKIHKLKINNIKFGNIDYPDFILLIMSGDKEAAMKKRKNYLNRTKNIRGNWKANNFSKNNLARKIIWFADY